jgi:ElaB/YqjD/DUF883 family membrane-anchored ribosome-binding protein
MNTDTTQLTQERLIGDLRLVIANAEQLLNNTNQYTSDIYQNARAKLTAALHTANEELVRVEDAHLARMIAATHAASEAYADQSGEARLLRAFR